MQKLHFAKQTTLRLAAIFATVGLLAAQANAGLIIDIADDGNDLVVNVSGSFDYGTFSDFTNTGTAPGLYGISGIYAYIPSNNLQGIPIALGVSDTSNWTGLFFKGSSQVLPLSNVTGQTTGGWRLDSTQLLIPENYISGTPWESSARVVGPVVKPSSGSYATFTMTETGDTFTFRYNSSFTPGGGAAVPEPSTAIVMGLLGIVGFAGNRRRRRQESVA